MVFLFWMFWNFALRRVTLKIQGDKGIRCRKSSMTFSPLGLFFWIFELLSCVGDAGEKNHARFSKKGKKIVSFLFGKPATSRF
jgi:hypothetical protein